MTGTGGAPLATFLAGPSRTKWLLMTGDLIDADRALRWGLVDKAVAPADLDAVADLPTRSQSGPPRAAATPV